MENIDHNISVPVAITRDDTTKPLGPGLGRKVIEKAIKDDDMSKVRDYMSYLVMDYGDLDNCPVDRDVIHKALAFLSDKYIFNPEGRSLTSVFVRRE